MRVSVVFGVGTVPQAGLGNGHTPVGGPAPFPRAEAARFILVSLCFTGNLSGGDRSHPGLLRTVRPSAGGTWALPPTSVLPEAEPERCVQSWVRPPPPSSGVTCLVSGCEVGRVRAHLGSQ